MNPKLNIRKYIEYKGITISEFCSKTKLSNGFLTNNGAIGSDKIHNIIRVYPDINIHWLITGEGEMLKDNNIINEPSASYHPMASQIQQNQAVPLYHLNIAKGLVSLFDSDTAPMPIDYITIPNLPKSDGAVFVIGDNMYPLLKSGDIIIYKQQELDIANIFFGEMYLISVNLHKDDYTSLKWIQRSDKGDDYIKLVSENKHHQPKDVHLSQVNAIALVKASIRVSTMR